MSYPRGYQPGVMYGEDVPASTGLSNIPPAEGMVNNPNYGKAADPSTWPTRPPVEELEDDERLGETDRVTPAGVISKGTNMGKMSLARANELTPGYEMGNLSNYFGGPTTSGEVEDSMDQSRQIGMGGLSPQMSRNAMFNFLDSDGTPVQALRARDAGLGLLRDSGNYYANIGGEMQQISQKQYNSIVRRDEGAIQGILQDLDDNFRMPGGNAPPQTSTPFASSVQQPLFEEPIGRMQAPLPGFTENAYNSATRLGADVFPGVYQQNPNASVGIGFAEDFYRANQAPIDNLTDELYKFK